RSRKGEGAVKVPLLSLQLGDVPEEHRRRRAMLECRLERRQRRSVVALRLACEPEEEVAVTARRIGPQSLPQVLLRLLEVSGEVGELPPTQAGEGWVRLGLLGFLERGEVPRGVAAVPL